MIYFYRMGIERFFSSIEENKITNYDNQFTKKLEKNITCKYLYIDFNSIVHKVSSVIANDLNFLLYHHIKNDKNKPEKYNTITNNYGLIVNNLDELLSLLTNDFINTLVIENVRKYLINIVTNYVNPDKLEHLYIAVDGVPSKSKMIEQKKRRYMGGLIREIKDRIFEEYEDSLKIDKIRYQYEKNKIHFDKNHISPGTEFMHKLHNRLSSPDLTTELKDLCKNLKTYTYSGVYEPGEGEKKIVDHLRSSNQEYSDYVIYSPDSDMTLLCLLLNTKDYTKKNVSRLQILRMNQQRGGYDIIDVDKLSANLFSYVEARLDKGEKKDKDSIIKDIVFLLTIFGDDFLPRIDSMDVRQEFNRVIDKYIKCLKWGNQYIVNYHKGNNRINFAPFKKIISLLAQDEDKSLQNVYMSNHYNNYNRLKKILDADSDNFVIKMNKFLDLLRRFNKDITQSVDKGENYKKVHLKWVGEQDFLDKLSKLVRLGVVIDESDVLVKTYFNHYKVNGELPKVKIVFMRYSATLNNEFQRERLNKSLDELDKDLTITTYDEEIFRFENMLDEYKEKLNAFKSDLGYVGVDYKTYTWKSDSVDKGINKYYRDYFGITDIKGDKMSKLIDDYLEGLIWVFNHYFNGFDIEENRDYAHTWFYKHIRSPLLRQIDYFLKEKDNRWLDTVMEKIEGEIVLRSDYFNCLEHFMYTSPVSLIPDMVPPEYQEYIEKNKKVINYDKIIKEILKHKTNDEVDCRGVLFLSKCHLKAIDNHGDTKNDLQFIKKLREIKLGYETSKRSGMYKKGNSNVIVENYKDLISIDKLQKN